MLLCLHWLPPTGAIREQWGYLSTGRQPTSLLWQCYAIMCENCKTVLNWPTAVGPRLPTYNHVPFGHFSFGLTIVNRWTIVQHHSVSKRWCNFNRRPSALILKWQRFEQFVRSFQTHALEVAFSTSRKLCGESCKTWAWLRAIWRTRPNGAQSSSAATCATTSSWRCWWWRWMKWTTKQPSSVSRTTLQLHGSTIWQHISRWSCRHNMTKGTQANSHQDGAVASTVCFVDHIPICLLWSRYSKPSNAVRRLRCTFCKQVEYHLFSVRLIVTLPRLVRLKQMLLNGDVNVHQYAGCSVGGVLKLCDWDCWLWSVVF